ncbi:hypothetical protein [Streptomyces sp. NPDC054804]
MTTQPGVASRFQPSTEKKQMDDEQMILGMQLGNGYGTQPGAWRAPGVDPADFSSFDKLVGYAQAAERGKLQFLFLPDFQALRVDIEHAPHGRHAPTHAHARSHCAWHSTHRHGRHRFRHLQ